MIEIQINENNVILHDAYKTIKSTTSITNRDGETKKYYNYNCSFPYPFQKMYNHPDVIYFYEKIGRVYITDEEPPDYYNYKQIKLHTRKNARQKSSKENKDKQWAKLVTIPKSIFGTEIHLYKTLHYELHCNQRDYVTQRLGLLEVYLSKRELTD